MAAVLIISILAFSLIPPTHPLPLVNNTEINPLLLLKSGFSDPSPLSTWNQTTSPSPCDTASPWVGVICDGGVIIGLNLENFSLSGYIDIPALSKLKSLRALSLVQNRFQGPIPLFNKLIGLKALYLSHNLFSGEIPDSFFDGMTHLKKLHLDDNQFTGSIPSSLSKCMVLKELQMMNNQFSGQIPNLELPGLRLLNISSNRLSGPIPEPLAKKFKQDSFTDNPGLCGPPLTEKPCPPPVLPAPPIPPAPPPPVRKNNTALMGGAFMAATLAFLLILILRSKKEEKFDTLGTNTREVKSEKGSSRGSVKSASSKAGSTKAGKKGEKAAGVANMEGDLVMVNEAKGVFGMSDLMKAAAEIMGSGGMGSAYKAVMENGTMLAVKRVREMNRVGKETFDVELRRLGRLKHNNVLPPLAYLHKKEEKLIISEFVPKGSLLYILHGDRGMDHAALNWPTRLKILVGIAHGMCYLQSELNHLDIPHGNLKSSNVLLTPDFEPLLVDYGFISLMNPSVASHSMFAYRSPESLTQRRLCAKADVYCFGIIILEVLIGKFPSQYLNNSKGGTDVIQWVHSAVAEDIVAELIDPAIIVDAKPAIPEMEKVIHVGVACVESNPDARIDMKEACRRLEEIATNVNMSTVVTLSRRGSYAELLREGSGRRATSITDRSRSMKGQDSSFAMS